MIFKKAIIASDHAGFVFKNEIIKYLKTLSLEVLDMGPINEERCDYPDYADLVTKKIKESSSDTCGILICGSGQGMAMRANKYSQARAALVWSKESAELSRAHNDANIICLGARLTDQKLAQEFLKIFLNTSFEGGRHADRVKKISSPV